MLFFPRIIQLTLLTAALLVPASFICAQSTLVIRGTTETTLAPHLMGNVYAPDIVKHGKSHLMFFGGQGKDGHDRIHLATSQDNKSWTNQGVVFAPKGINHVNDPSVLVKDDLFFMYYTRANAGVTDTIGLAASKDGKKWTDKGTVLGPGKKPAWDSLLVGRPSVLFDGNKYRMWYDGRADLPIGAPDQKAPKSTTSQRYVGYAESSDGIQWKKRDRFVFAHDSGGVHVTQINDQFLMSIETRQGTVLATSNNGIDWTHRGLLIKKETETSPHGHVTPFLQVNEKQLWLYFGAAKSQAWNENSIRRIPVDLNLLK